MKDSCLSGQRWVTPALPIYTDSKCAPSPSLATPHHAARKSRFATALACVGLLGLASLSTYALFGLSLPHFPTYRPQRPIWKANFSVTRAPKVSSTYVHFTPHQELVAVTTFVTALSSNALPPVDPSSPIDPNLVLDFDVGRNPEELIRMEEDTWSRYPVILYSKHYCAISRSVKAKLDSLQLKPAPIFIDVDLRDDAPTLSSILYRTTGAAHLPILLIGGQVLHTDSPEQLIAALDYLLELGELERIMAEAGTIVGGARKPALKQRVQADPRKHKAKELISHEERVFRGLITL